MANATVSTNNQVIRFRTDFAKEYVRNNRLSAYAGKGMSMPICMKQDTGPTIRHPLVTRLKGNGVTGSTTLRGNGENVGDYSWDELTSLH